MRLIIFTLFLSTLFTTSIFAQDNHCLDFNGNNNVVVVNGFDINGDFTLSTWFRCNAVSNSNFEERILSFGPTDRFEIGIQDGSNKLWFYDSASGDNLSFGNDLRDGEWHKVTYTRSGLNRTLYLDGSQVVDYQTTAVTYGENFRIGAWTGGSSTTTFFNGKVDETRIWSVAKTAEEINETYFCPITGDEDDLLAYWNYDQGNPGGVNPLETTLFDRSPNGRNGTLSNFNLLGNSSNWIESDNDLLYYLDANISQNGNELVANTNLATAYQWLDCNDNFSEIAGATEATFSPSTSGSYAFQASNFACAQVSECFDFIAVSTKDVLNETDLLVYPNPSSDFVLVDKKVAGEVNLVITDQLGNVLFVEKTAQQITEIDLNDFPKGLYYLSVENIVRKIVKF